MTQSEIKLIQHVPIIRACQNNVPGDIARTLEQYKNNEPSGMPYIQLMQRAEKYLSKKLNNLNSLEMSTL